MTDSVYGATVAKRRLSRRLTELRLASGYTGNQVCDKLDWGRGKVGRFESNQWRRPEMSDIRDLLRLYEMSEDERRELEQLAVLARARAWWRDYADVYDNEFPGFEGDAVRIRAYTPLMVPGLLQTPAYIDAYMRIGSGSSAWRDRALEARLRRQDVLDLQDGGAPELVAVITEASLMYRWGSVDDRRAQLAHLIEASRRPTVELRLLRFEDGPHPGMCGPINIFDFPGDEPGMVYLETDFALEEVNKPAEVDAYIEIFSRAQSAALEPEATTVYLKQLAETLVS